jgi:lysophospholipase L1-like esterase
VKLALCAAIASLFALAASADEATLCRAAFCGGEALGPFFDKLEAGPVRGQTINILQIGDSHSAGDNLAGGWREPLQEHYGNGGRGAMPPGKPFDGYIPRDVTVTQSAGWSVTSLFDSSVRNGLSHPLFGISGFRQTAAAAGATLTMTPDTPAFSFRRFVVCAVMGPGQGAYTLRLGAAVTRQVSLDAPETHVGCTTVQSETRQSIAEIDVDAGPVTLTSWGGFTDNGGVTLSNLGVVGAQISNFAETNDAAVRTEMEAYHPDLVVIEFGTNDGFVGHFDPETYEAVLISQIQRIRRLSDHTPILLLGAPDADTDRADLANNAPASAGDPHPGPGFWYPPPGLAAVRNIQRRVARELGVAFWDWSSRMGGPGTADRWANADPPLIRRDRVHYTVAGGRKVGALLDSDFEAAKAAYILSGR